MIMGTGKRLTTAESKIIQTLHEEGKPKAEIVRITKRSRCAVRNVIRDPKNYGKKVSAGRRRVVSPQSEWRIIRLASNSTLTAQQIAGKAGVDIAIRNVRNIIARAKHLKRRKLQRKPPLIEKHKLPRMAFAENHLP